jgi:hypothetical protein
LAQSTSPENLLEDIDMNSVKTESDMKNAEIVNKEDDNFSLTSSLKEKYSKKIETHGISKY